MITYGPNAKQLPPAVEAIIARVLAASGNPSCVVTSTIRTPFEQARAIHDLCVEHGVAYARDLYSGHSTGRAIPFPGCKVIDCFVALVSASKADTILAMQHVIEALGPANVSHHCGDPSKLAVADVAGLADRAAFHAAALKESAIVKVLGEGDHDPVEHLEVPLPATTLTVTTDPATYTAPVGAATVSISPSLIWKSPLPETR